MYRVIFSLIDDIFHKQVLGFIERNDPLGILATLPKGYGLEFIRMNIKSLMAQSIYEETLLHAFSIVKTNWSHVPVCDIKYLFDIADENRLLKAGDPLPEDGPFTLYRGISGNGYKRRKRGISWTSSFKTAKWFAERSSWPNPEVYMAHVKKKFVYVYDNGREEREFICNIPKHIKLKKVWP
jgi:hypothetical protein